MFRWCHDIGREQAANKPLLKTVFQVSHWRTLCKPLIGIMNVLIILIALSGYDEII